MVVELSYFTKVAKRIAILAISVVILVLLFKLSVFYMPFLVAFIISLILEHPIRFFMKKFNLKRRTSSIIIFLIAIAIITGMLVWGISTLVSEASNLMQGINNYIDKAYVQIENITSQLDVKRLHLPEQVEKILETSNDDFFINITTWIKSSLSKLLDFLMEIPTIAIYTSITLVALYFMCVDKVYMVDEMEHHFPTKWVKKIGTHIREITSSLGNYLKAEFILVFVSFVISLIGFYLLNIIGIKINYPLLIALGIAFVDALPILGSGTIMLPWAVISAADGNLELAIGILALWGIMSVVRQFLEPKLVSNKIGIHPIFTLIAMYTGFKFLGVWGMVLGPIILIILKNIFSTLIDKGVVKAILER